MCIRDSLSMAQNVFIFTRLLSSLVMFNTGLEKNRVLKECAYVQTPPLVQLYSLCLNTSTFPQCWKHAHVQPIPKKGSRSDPSNYRPITLTSIPSKIFETLLNSHFLDHLESHSLLSDRQYGFRRSRSTGEKLSYMQIY